MHYRKNNNSSGSVNNQTKEEKRRRRRTREENLAVLAPPALPHLAAGAVAAGRSTNHPSFARPGPRTRYKPARVRAAPHRMPA